MCRSSQSGRGVNNSADAAPGGIYNRKVHKMDTPGDTPADVGSKIGDSVGERDGKKK